MERIPASLRVCALWSIIAVLCGLTFAGCGGLSSFFSGGGDSTPATTNIVVADANNNRVLIYAAPVSTNGSATTVLGQSATNTSASGSDGFSLYYPAGAVADGSGNIWVADFGNCRVVEYTKPFSNGMKAALVLGQTTVDSSTCPSPINDKTIGGPSALRFDSNGNLWVVDYTNSRILEYKPPFASGMAATLVIGQLSMDAGNCTWPGGAGGLCRPWGGIAFDKNGNLWVSDTSNCRVVKYAAPLTSSMSATLVLGQSTLNNSVCDVSATALNSPTGLAFDSSGNLWVADEINDRVLEFTTPLATNMSATLVLGQTGMGVNGCTVTEKGLCQVSGIAFDSSGNLYVTDTPSNRTLVYKPSFSSNMSATTVLGQADMTHALANQGGSVGPNTQRSPSGVTPIP